MRTVSQRQPVVDAGRLSVKVATTVDDLQQAMPMWLDLLDRGAIGHNVHNDPRMILFRLQEQPTLQPHILMVSRGDRLVCIAPFYIQPARFSLEFSVWRFLSLRTRTLRIFGERVVLAHDVDVAPCVAVVADLLQTFAASIDYLQVFGMIQSDLFWQAACGEDALHRHCDWMAVAMRNEKVHQIRLMHDFNAYMSSRSAATRQGMRRASRHFFEDSLARVEVITDPNDVPQLMRWMDSIYGSSWQAQTFGKSKRSKSAELGLLEQVAAERWLRSYVLLRGGTPLAYQHGCLYRRVFYRLDCAFDQKYSSDGPGSVLMSCLLEDLHKMNAADLVDLGFGHMPYKKSLGNIEVDAAIVYFVPRNRWRVILRFQQLLNSVYDGMRTALMRLRIDRLIRKLIKRQK